MPAGAPTWGKFVSHYDSVGQAATMVASFNPGNTIVSLLFDRMSLSVQGTDKGQLTASIGLAGHFPIALPDEFALRGFLLVAKGTVIKTFDSSAVLTLSIGESGRAFEWPRTSKVVQAGGGEKSGTEPIEFAVIAECFSSDDHSAIGNPPTFPPIPPLTLAIGMHARRRSVEGAVLMSLDSIDIGILDFHPGLKR